MTKNALFMIQNTRFMTQKTRFDHQKTQNTLFYSFYVASKNNSKVDPQMR